MAIKIIGDRAHKTAAVTSGMWSGQNNAGLHARFMVDPAAVPSQMNEPWIAGRDNYTSVNLFFVGAGTQPGTTKIRAQVMDLANNLYWQFIDNVVPGVVYCIGITHDAVGIQRYYLNAVPTTISTFTGSCKSNGATNSPWSCGGRGVNTPGAGAIWTLDDVLAWNGYTPTQADMTALRDGADPTTIGTGATTRYRWTCAVPAGKALGDTVVVGDSGLNESYGITAQNLTTVAGPGTSVYAAPLVWSPAIRVREARVSTSGKMAFFFTETISTHADSPPTSVATAPVVTVNGVNRGQLGNLLASGIHKYAAGSMPAGVVVAPTDVVTFDAPVQWLTTNSGVAEAMVAKAAVNRAGRSSMSTETLPKTLGMGLNVEWFLMGYNALTPLLKNYARRLSGFSDVATKDSTGKPLTLTLSPAGATLYSFPANLAPNGIDATGYPGPTGLFAIGWDDLHPSTPVSFRIVTGDAATTTVTPRADLTNPGVGGIGQVRVYDVQRAIGSTLAQTEVWVYMDCPSLTPQFDNLVINGPGDFTPVAPVRLDNSDPYALSSWMLDRLKGAYSLRCVNSTLCDAAYSAFIEPEQVNTLTDFCWGWYPNRPYPYLSRVFTRADPYSVADTPYFYSPSVGPPVGAKFAATLAADITSPTATSITVSDAATAPLIIGLRLFIDSEILRITSISGTTVTVIRGAEDTTPATHAAGAIQVGYRLPSLAINDAETVGAIVKFTTSAPHGFTTGHQITYGGSGWPTFVYTNGTSGPPTAYGSVARVTGPDTFVGTLGPYNSPQGTLTGAVTLPATCTTLVQIGGGPQVPYGMVAKMAAYVGSPNQWIELPHACTNDFMRRVARELRDNSTPGTIIWWVGMSDEVWNYAVPNGYYAMVSNTMPGRPYLGYSVVRTGEMGAIFRAIFDEGGRDRSGEIRTYITANPVIPNQGGGFLQVAAARVPPVRIDGMGAANYFDGSYTGPAHQGKFGVLDADQCADLLIHGITYRTDGQSLQAWASGFQSYINTYNSATGFNCKLIAYEGGLAYVTGSRTKDRDVFYSPVWYWAEQDFYALAQQCGWQVMNVYASAHDWNNGVNMWGLYHHHFQPHGRGDGSDGLADNRLTLATTKPATTNQDAANVSVRGQAWLDWNAAFAPEDLGGSPVFVLRPARARWFRGRGR